MPPRTVPISLWRRVSLGLLLLGFSLLPQGILHAQGPSEWTILYYSAADTNLEFPMMNDLREMMEVGATDQVRIIALVDRAAEDQPEGQYTGGALANLPNWTTAKLLTLEKGKVTELEDWGEVNEGDPETLKRFIQAGVQKFPAKKYALLVGDHGASWPGCCNDNSHDHDGLTMMEFRGVLDATAGVVSKYEILGFDACLMGNFESAQLFASHTNYFVGSEETEPGDGWHYTPVLQALTQNPAMNGDLLGKAILDGFNAYYNGSNDPNLRREGETSTLSLYKMDGISAMESAVNGLAEALRGQLQGGGRDAWLKVSAAREAAEQFGKMSGGQGFEVFDLAHLAQLLAQQFPNTPVATAANAVLAAVGGLVIHNVHGQSHPNANGITIYFPSAKDKLDGARPPFYKDLLFSTTGKWLSLLTDFTQMALGDQTGVPPAPVEVTDTQVQPGEETTVTSEIPPSDDLKQAYLVLARQDGPKTVFLGFIALPVPSSGAQLQIPWDATWLTVEMGGKKAIVAVDELAFLDEFNFLATVPARVKSQGATEWQDITMVFYLFVLPDETVAGELLYALAITPSGILEYPLFPGDQIQPMFMSQDAQGQLRPNVPAPASDILTVPNDFIRAGETRVPDGQYAIGFLTVDYSDNVKSSLAEVTVGNGAIVVAMDVNGDKIVDVSDAVMTLQIIVGTHAPTPAQQSAADANADGGVDISDAVKILRRVVGIE